MLTSTFAIEHNAARSGLQIIALPIDDGGRMSVPMIALDGIVRMPVIAVIVLPVMLRVMPGSRTRRTVSGRTK